MPVAEPLGQALHGVQTPSG